MVFVNIPGEIQVYDWAAIRIQIGTEVIETMTSLRCLRTNTYTVGDCSIAMADDYGDLYDSLDYLDEIFIYIQDPDDIYTPNQVWGGWLEDKHYGQGKSHLLQVTGKEYSSALLDKYYTHTFATDTDLGVIATDIVDDDGTLSSANIPSQTYKKIQLDFDKERHWDALDIATSQLGYEFGVPLTQKVYVREIGDAPLSPDEIILSENAIEVSQNAQGSNIITDVTVQGNSSAISSNVSDSDLEELYGRSRELYQINSDATDSGTTSEAASTILSNQKELIKKYTVKTLFLPQTEPNDLITVSIEGTELSADYKVVSIEHVISNKGQITSEVVLNNRGINDSDILTNLLKSYSKTAKKTWV